MTTDGRAKAGGEWQPIEAAPRDGHRILLAGEQDGIYWTAIGHWAPYDGCRWNDDDGRKLTGNITHWMPLPAPPLTARPSAPQPIPTVGE